MAHPHRVILVKTIFQKIVEINKSLGITILLVDQNANLALEVSYHGYVLETGRIIMHDRSSALRANEKVKSAYLDGALAPAASAKSAGWTARSETENCLKPFAHSFTIVGIEISAASRGEVRQRQIHRPQNFFFFSSQ